MTKPMKHAEVIKAAADGKDVQFTRNNQWVDWLPRASQYTPFREDHVEWRIKPEPEPDVVEHRIVSAISARGFHSFPADPNLQLIFDGETGDLKEAKVICKE